jgi:hypothetical protein
MHIYTQIKANLVYGIFTNLDHKDVADKDNYVLKRVKKFFPEI